MGFGSLSPDSPPSYGEREGVEGGRSKWGCIVDMLDINIPFMRLSRRNNANFDHMQLGKGKKAPTARGGGVGLESKNRGGAL